MSKWTLPIKTEWMKSQMEHEASRSYSEEIYNLVKEFPYNKALEIGAAWGLSTLAILLAQEKGILISVDKNDKVEAINEVKKNDLDDRWHFICQDSKDFWKTQSDKKGTFDLIYIDGSHIYEDVNNDLFQAWEYLRNGGLLIFDDVVHKNNRTGEYGVSLAAWQLIVEQEIKEIGTTTRLGYIYK